MLHGLSGRRKVPVSAMTPGRNFVKVPVYGGRSVALYKAPSDAFLNTAVWRIDGVIIQSQFMGEDLVLTTVSDQGEEPILFMVLDSVLDDQALRYPQFLPDGQTLMFVSMKIKL